jgi:glycosyltransferase involved in cell wall biosynthesis
MEVLPIDSLPRHAVISVLLPFRDAGSTLLEAMESVLGDLGSHDELVAIDDGSGDASADIARALAERDERVVLAASGGSPARAAGIAVALTRGLVVSRGELVARMDGDDVSLPGRFAAQQALLESDATLGAVGVQVEAFPTPRRGMQRYVAWQTSLVSRSDHANAIFCESPLCHPSTMMRRAALLAVGGYRDDAWAEDYDLWLRLDAAGYGLAKVPRVLFRWRMRPDSLTWTDPRYSPARLLETRAAYLARRLLVHARPFAVWGAGQTGRRLARALEAHDQRPVAFVDIDPRKIGRSARGLAITSAAEGIARASSGELLLVVAVGDHGARDIVRARLTAAGLIEGTSYICAA